MTVCTSRTSLRPDMQRCIGVGPAGRATGILARPVNGLYDPHSSAWCDRECDCHSPWRFARRGLGRIGVDRRVAACDKFLNLGMPHAARTTSLPAEGSDRLDTGSVVGGTAARRSGQRQRFSKERISGAGSVADAALLSRAHRKITDLVASAHRDGDHGRYIDLITAARILKRELARLDQKSYPP